MKERRRGRRLVAVRARRGRRVRRERRGGRRPVAGPGGCAPGGGGSWSPAGGVQGSWYMYGGGAVPESPSCPRERRCLQERRCQPERASSGPGQGPSRAKSPESPGRAPTARCAGRLTSSSLTYGSSHVSEWFSLDGRTIAPGWCKGIFGSVTRSDYFALIPPGRVC